MKTILFAIAFILNIQFAFSQDIIKPSPPCFDCPDWARSMNQFEWESWKEADKAEREKANREIYKSSEPSKDGLKIGATLVGIGALAQIISLSIDPVPSRKADAYHEATHGNSSLIKTFAITGLSAIALGGITMAWSF